jgi:hypothetical protein
MKIKIPVECQNGHKAFWYYDIRGLDVVTLGVPSEDKCNCPKWNFGEGYHSTGDPEIVSEPTHDPGGKI